MGNVYSLLAKISADVSGLEKGLSKGIDKIKGFAKFAVATLGTLGLGKIIGDSVSAGGDLQQSLGGTEKLFGKHADMVKKNAKKAYKTAGVSANDYLEGVNSFAASLLQSTKGNTEEAAKAADKAFRDMSDNANMYGTDIQSIQNAYQGFAKQQYAMLDNLKLGYGGSKTEMERLLKDATALSNVKYDINNLSDVYEAIHVIQEKVGVTGTTAKEANETLSGSFAAMASAWENLKGRMALGDNIDEEIKAMVDTIKVYLFNNLIPMVVNVLGKIPQLVGEAIKYSIPEIQTSLKTAMTKIFGADMTADFFSSFGEIVPFIKSTGTKIEGVFSKIVENIYPVFDAMVNNLRKIPDGISAILDLISPMIDDAGSMLQNLDFSGLTKLFEDIIPQVKDGMGGLGKSLQSSVETISGIFLKLWNGIQPMFAKIPELFGAISGAIKPVVDIINNALSGMDFSGIINLANAIIPAITNAFEVFMSIVTPAIQVVTDGFTNLWNALQPVFSMLADALLPIFDVLASFLGGIVSGILEKIGSLFELLAIAIEWVTPAIKWLLDGFVALQPVFSMIAEWIGKIIGWFGNLGSASGGLKEFIKSAWNGIKAAIGAAADFISGAVNFIKGLWSGLKSAGSVLSGGLSGIWSAISGFVTNAKNIISTAINGIKTFFGNLGKTGETLRTTLSNAWKAVTGAIEGAYSTIKGIIDSIIGLFKGLWNIDITGAGKAIMNGFVGGLKSIWEGGKKFIGGIGDWIKRNKGPISYDRKLLIPAGKAIMGGLNKSLISTFDDVKNNVSSMAGDLQNAFGTANLDTDMNMAKINKSVTNQMAITGASLTVAKQPANITLQLGQRQFEFFVNDIFDAEEKITNLEIAYKGG